MKIIPVSNQLNTKKRINFGNLSKINSKTCVPEKLNLSEILFFSGSFNPIHKAHVFIANDIKQKLNCKKVVMIPAFSPYHKATDLKTSFEDKMAMTKLAVSDMDGFEVSDIDKRANDGNSYSYNTVNKFIEELYPEGTSEKLNFLMGADSFMSLNKWYKFDELAKLVRFIVSTRNGEANPAAAAEVLKKELPSLDYKIFNENIEKDISSSLARKNIKNGESAEQYLDKKVIDYIKKHKLYRSG